MRGNETLVLALPRGRILGEVTPLLKRAGIEIERAFDDPQSRQLRFTTNHDGLDVIRVRSFDVATFVAFGAAQLGIAGSDVLMEFDYPEIYVPLDSNVGRCRLVVAAPKEDAGRDDPSRWSHVRIATKYPEMTRRHFAQRGVQAECIVLNGAMELAPSLGLIATDRRSRCRPAPPCARTGSSRSSTSPTSPRASSSTAPRSRPASRRSATGSSASARWPMPLEARHLGGRLRATRSRAFWRRKREKEADVDAVVAAIIADVRARGDRALIELSKRFDRVELTPASLRVSAAEIAAAKAACGAAALAALRLAHGRIVAYHEKQRPADLDYTDDAGVRLGAHWRPLASVGLYVPGGTASYPSSVLMNAVPAKVAGVARIVMAVPAPAGIISPLVLAAAELAGVTEVYRIGGAQAIAALAYGTESIAAVDKITGPGNAYVAAAKRRVFGTVGLDMIAGPSEILVVADRANNPDWIAADLLSQAEHDGAAQSILIADDKDFAAAVGTSVARQLASLPRAAIAGESWRDHGAIILVRNFDEAVPLIDRIAAEHVELAVERPEALAARINNAGAIFLGRHTPEAVGDYVAGPNHVLPTSRSARFSSGLGVLDFMKRTSLIACDAASLRAIGPAAITLAEAEGLDAHARSIAIRLNLAGG